MARTNAEYLISYLTLMGNNRVHGRSSKYTVFENRKRPGSHYYVGRNGALRIGSSIDCSRSCTEQINMASIRKWVDERETYPMSHEVCVSASDDVAFINWWMQRLKNDPMSESLNLNILGKDELPIDEAKMIIRNVLPMETVVQAYTNYHKEVLGDGDATNSNEQR